MGLVFSKHKIVTNLVFNKHKIEKKKFTLNSNVTKRDKTSIILSKMF